MSGAPSLLRPGYDPADRSPGIAHVGVGNFHRAHQAVYVDDLLSDGACAGWGISGINLVPGGGALLGQIRRRGMRYVLKTVSPDSDVAYREVASILDCVDATEDPGAAAARIADARTRLVTLTVTGAGYHLTSGGELDLSAPAVAVDVAGGSSTIYGLLRDSLRGRMSGCSEPLAVLSCDNLRGNGRLLKAALESFLEEAGEGALKPWAADCVSFPCSMVDRITPVTPADLSAEVAEAFGIEGDPSLMSEDYIQWVIEDDFAGGRPPLEDVGVTLTGDVLAHEEVKIRVLNAGHSAVGYVSALRGHEYVWQAMRDEGVSSFLDGFEREEVLPGIGKAAGIDVAGYYETTKARFANPNLDDTVARICRRGTSKVPEFLGPTIRASYEGGRVPARALTVVASWYEVMRRCAAGDGPIKYEDSGWDGVRQHLSPGGEEGFARDARLWGGLPDRHAGFAGDLVSRIIEVRKSGGADPLGGASG